MEFNQFSIFNEGLWSDFIQTNKLCVYNGAEISGDVYINSTPTG